MDKVDLWKGFRLWTKSALEMELGPSFQIAAISDSSKYIYFNSVLQWNVRFAFEVPCLGSQVVCFLAHSFVNARELQIQDLDLCLYEDQALPGSALRATSRNPI